MLNDDSPHLVNLSPSSYDPAFGQAPGADGSVKSKIITLIASVRTLMRSMARSGHKERSGSLLTRICLLSTTNSHQHPDNSVRADSRMSGGVTVVFFPWQYGRKWHGLDTRCPAPGGMYHGQNSASRALLSRSCETRS